MAVMLGGTASTALSQAAWQVPPSLEQTARVLVIRAAGSNLWATESKLLGGKHGASDFILDLHGGPACKPAERRWAVVEVDGSQHFDRPRKDTGRAKRRRIDVEKDEAAWQQRRPVLRLHYADQADWPDLLAAAREYGRQPQLVTFALYTDSYTQTSKALLQDGIATTLEWWKVGGWVARAHLERAVGVGVPARGVGDPVGAQHSQLPVHSIHEVHLGVAKGVQLLPLVLHLAPLRPPPPSQVDARESDGAAEEQVLVNEDGGLPPLHGVERCLACVKPALHLLLPGEGFLLGQGAEPPLRDHLLAFPHQVGRR